MRHEILWNDNLISERKNKKRIKKRKEQDKNGYN